MNTQYPEELKHEIPLTHFFNTYPIEFVEERIASVFQSILPYPTENESSSLNYMSLFYEELTHMIKNCALMCEQNKSKLPLICSSKNLKSLNAIISFLKEVIPAGYIFCITANTSRIDLLIVLDRYRYKPFDEIHSLIAFAMLGHQNINCTVQAYGTMYDILLKGHLYYSAMCTPENCIYQNEIEFTLPLIDKEKYFDILNQSKATFKQNIHKSIIFFKGTKQFLESNENTIAAFMLQQACELGYRSLLLTLKGKEVKCHDLIILRKHLSHFDASIIGSFDDNEQEELSMLATIQQAYIKGRYDQDYEISTCELIRLSNAGQNFIQKVQQIFDDYCTRMLSILNFNIQTVNII